MNNLTQQQINQYQWQVADGEARIVNPYFHSPSHDMEAVKGYLQIAMINEHQYHTNAPDGIYSGEAFELADRWYSKNQNKWIDGSAPYAQEMYRDDVYPIEEGLFLRLKPSHLPAVLTTQPGDEWKDRYTPLYEYYNAATDKWAECDASHGHPVYPTRTTWHLITPPAEQEAETVDNNGTIEPIIDCGAGARSVALWLESYCNTSLPYHNMVSDAARKAAKHIDHLQSTLTQKDQRIAELERGMEWINIEDRLPEDKTRVLCVAVHPNGNRWIQIYRYSTDIGFDWMHDYEPILWQLLPTSPQV
jgi:hypothetical protein